MVSAFNIRRAARSVFSGHVIAYPTEAVYGLGCDPYQQQAVYKILKLKNRPVEKGLILVGSQLQQFDDFIEPLSNEHQQLIASNPATSWIVPAKKAPEWLRGQHNSLAIRLSAHPLVKTLCNELEQALVSTSANPAGKSPARKSLQVHHYFHNDIDIILCDKTGELSKPTEIRDLKTRNIIRAN